VAKLKATNYQDIHNLLSKKNKEQVKLGHNTYASWGELPGQIVIRFHQSDIVKLRISGTVFFNLAGWPTVTTRDRINQFVPGRVSQNKGEQFYNGKPIDSQEWIRG